jgi:hypothetical protein
MQLLEPQEAPVVKAAQNGHARPFTLGPGR